MAAPQSSVSSRNQAVEGPVLSSGAGRRIGRGAAHETYDLASDASNKPPTPPLKSVTVCIGITSNAFKVKSPSTSIIASNAFKVKSPLPENASSTSIIHSSWIQRLKPTSRSCTAKDEPPIFSKKESFVCTHFAKDYSSCNRRLNIFTHHTRSASWPPHGSQSEVVRQLALEVEKPACHSPEEHYATATNSAHVNHQDSCLWSKNVSQSSEAGSRTGSQQDGQKRFRPLEGFVARAQLIALNRRPHNLQYSNEREHRKPESCSGQQFQDHIKGEVKSEFVTLFEQRNVRDQSHVVKEDNWAYIDGALPTINSAPSRPVSACGTGYSSGASADADASNRCDKPLTFGVSYGNEIVQSVFGEVHCRGNYAAADASREKQKLGKFGLIIPCKEEAVRDSLSVGLKDAVDLHLPQARQNFDLFKGKAYLQKAFSSRRVDNSHLSNFVYQRPGASTREDTTTCGDGSGTVWTSALNSQNLIERRMDASYTSHTPKSGEAGRASKSPVSFKSLHEDAARVRIRGKSLGDYWNSWDRLLEEQDPGRPINTGHSKAFLQQDFATGYCEDFCQQQSLRTKQDIQNFNSCKSHEVNFAKIGGAYESDERNLILSKFSDPRTKSRELITLSDYTSNFVVDHSQKQYLYSHEGASGRVDSQPHNKHSGFHRRFPVDGSSTSRMHSVNPSLDVINDEASRRELNMHRGWLQRWLSVGKFSAVPGKPLALYDSQSMSSDQLAKLPKSYCANAQCTIGSSHKGISPCERNLSLSDRGSNRDTDTRLDCGSPAFPGFRPASQNFATFRSGYVGPSIEAMALAGKQHPTSLQYRGFDCLPCARPKTFGCITFEDGKDADEDKVHFVNSNDLRDLDGDIGDS